MKRLIASLLTLILVLGLSSASAANQTEQKGEDYSWLDDLTIRQLKELDAEIHKRIPYEGEGTRVIKKEADPDILLGTWEYIVDHDYSDPKYVSWYGHKIRYTLEFYESGVGNVKDYDLTEDRVHSEAPCTYEMEDSSTVVIHIAFFGEFTYKYKLQEDENGFSLVKITDDSYIYRKIAE